MSIELVKALLVIARACAHQEKLRPMSVERVLRQDLLEFLSQRTGDREQL